MNETSKEIKFINKQNSFSRFDFVNYEKIHQLQSPSHSSFKYHTVMFYALIFITEGEGEHYIDFEKYECKRGTLLLVGKRQVHKFQKDSRLKGYILLFHDDFLTNVLSTEATFHTFQLFNHSIFKPQLQLNLADTHSFLVRIKNIQQEYFITNDKFTARIIGGEIYTALSFISRLISKGNQIETNHKYFDKFVELQNLVKQHIFQTTKVEDYAKHLAISTKTLNTITKKIVNRTAKTYINEYYLLRIKRTLSDKSLSIKECAFQTGFDDIPNFYKFFKRHFKLTPEQFRQTFY